MKIHEYQAKELLRQYGVLVPEGKVAETPEEVEQIARELGGVVVVKAQIHAGGRGKGGGVKVVKSPEEARAAGEAILGMQLVTHQTGPEGQKVKKVWVEKGSNIAKEFYAGLTLDREKVRDTFMVSTEGGMEIEKVAAETPDKIVKAAIDPAFGLQPFEATRLAFALGLEGKAVRKAASFFMSLYKAYTESDATLAEINPLVLTEEGDIIAVDAKMNFDDNAMYRHKDIAAWRDLDEEDAAEVEASEFDLNFIKLDGSVGCMVNGAGLAMATMDIIKFSGGDPANFLDVGGTANAESVRNAFRIILKDTNVKAVLINIFGGIVRCDRVAQGIIDALTGDEVSVNVPVVVRLEGTNAEQASEMLNNAPLEFIVATDLKDAAEKVVAAAK
ncbi:succinyl-CoA ligase [ADP-forming] subunit beta [bacterium BMS3Bbin04]|nr:succinyl-CoA ligase [ADP-forming] subunit beta [bacterium BMS3Bbin04]